MAELRSQQEIDMAAELEQLGVVLEAYIFRPPVDWDMPLYGYRLTWADGRSHVGHLPWDEKTLGFVLAAARGGKKGAKK